jgi:hypothetical protein
LQGLASCPADWPSYCAFTSFSTDAVLLPHPLKCRDYRGADDASEFYPGGDDFGGFDPRDLFAQMFADMFMSRGGFTKFSVNFGGGEAYFNVGGGRGARYARRHSKARKGRGGNGSCSYGDSSDDSEEESSEYGSPYNGCTCGMSHSHSSHRHVETPAEKRYREEMRKQEDEFWRNQREQAEERRMRYEQRFQERRARKAAMKAKREARDAQIKEEKQERAREKEMAEARKREEEEKQRQAAEQERHEKLREKRAMAERRRQILFEGAAEGDVQRVMDLLGSQSSLLDACREGSSGPTLLHVCISSGQRELMESILSLRAGEHPAFDVFVEGLTPLHLAASCGNVEMVGLLADRMPKSKLERTCLVHGWTPLMYGAMGGHAAVVEALLSLGARCATLSEPTMCEKGAPCLTAMQLVASEVEGGGHSSQLTSVLKKTKTILEAAEARHRAEVQSRKAEAEKAKIERMQRQAEEMQEEAERKRFEHELIEKKRRQLLEKQQRLKDEEEKNGSMAAADSTSAPPSSSKKKKSKGKKKKSSTQSQARPVAPSATLPGPPNPLIQVMQQQQTSGRPWSPSNQSAAEDMMEAQRLQEAERERREAVHKRMQERLTLNANKVTSIDAYQQMIGGGNGSAAGAKVSKPISSLEAYQKLLGGGKEPEGTQEGQGAPVTVQHMEEDPHWRTAESKAPPAPPIDVNYLEEMLYSGLASATEPAEVLVTQQCSECGNRDPSSMFAMEDSSIFCCHGPNGVGCGNFVRINKGKEAEGTPAAASPQPTPAPARAPKVGGKKKPNKTQRPSVQTSAASAPAPAPVAAPAPLDETEVVDSIYAQLLEMGFDFERIQEATSLCGFDLERLLNYLMAN